MYPVDIKGIQRSYSGSEVLKHIDLKIARGEFVALLGRSGSGKSTLLRILAGLDRPDGGTTSISANVAIVFQDARLLPWENVARNVAMGLTEQDAKERVRNALAEVGLSHRIDAWPVTLSGGEAQRAALARALVREPDLLLLDEPFGALDALTRIAMHDLVLELFERHRPAVFMVTHDVDEAIKLADRILVLDNGHIHAEFTVERSRDGSLAAASTSIRADLLRALGVAHSSGRSRTGHETESHHLRLAAQNGAI
ncbi:ABC transporter ATP-binding protein [Bradyrhizobium sp. dw_411]|uniref:ABC transporter ATP-binding protein n=1 Tax=Bradyrhizobium sp. dw_411 TaxID=2720082 RepID=UPI001BCF1ED9|nr:ABC transporter ATP-binding protein [Bradyrhizobium sp. dw_411]